MQPLPLAFPTRISARPYSCRILTQQFAAGVLTIIDARGWEEVRKLIQSIGFLRFSLDMRFSVS